MERLSRRTFLRDLLVACTIGAGVSGLTAQSPAANPVSDTRLVGHRGCAAEFPENSLDAAERAPELVDAVELDIRRAASGELVVAHDATVDRVADGSGPVAEHTLTELRALSGRENGTDRPIPSLETALDAIPSSVDVVFDLKIDGIAASAHDTASSFDGDVLFSSFSPSILESVRDLGRKSALIVREPWLGRRFRAVVARTSAPIYPQTNVGSWLETATRLDCVAIHPRLELCLRTDLVERAHERGLLVEPWTITTAAQADRLRSVGVDGLISDICAPLAR
jgi:glycerophosphoryl diester phosphodiesterase